METILVVNAGSSSVKFQVFAVGGKDPVCLVKGQMDGIRTQPRLRVTDAEKRPLADQSYSTEQVGNVTDALQTAAEWLRASQNLQPIAVGHRVVHGGPEYSEPVLVDPEVLGRLERYIALAPLHQPNNLSAIRAILSRYPNLPQVACFDTAFHRQHDAIADHYALPEQLYAEGVRRYGFHGLSYEFVFNALKQAEPKVAAQRIIIAHLGSGASMCAVNRGRSIDSTMGFTALDGLPMGTRPGQLDPGVVLYLVGEKGMTAAEVTTLLYNQSGLKGLSGLSNDVRDLERSSEPRAQFALDYFVHRVGLSAGQLAAALEGLDAFVFTGGIGENSPSARSRIVEKLAWLGASIDPDANREGRFNIAGRSSSIGLYIVPTNEELMIARHTTGLLAGRAPKVRSQKHGGAKRSAA